MRDARHAVRHDDDDDRDAGFGRPREFEQPTTAGMIGFILALVSLGLLGVVAILWYALSVENQNMHDRNRSQWMFLWFAIVDITSFLTAMAAAVFSGRGLSPSNPLYRGWSMTGLILSITEIIVAMILGMFIFCCGLLTLN